jgi:ferredoxin--NADP+ reductase
VQAAYTNPELRELGELKQADVIVDPADVELDEHSLAFIERGEADATARRNVEIVREYAQREPTGKPKRLVLRFLVSPVEIIGSDRVEAVRVVRNELTPTDDGRLVATPTVLTETIPAGLVLRSVGYRGTPIPGLPFDERRATLPHDAGRVIVPETGDPLPGVYATGWIKRGPSGVIGTNKKCAQETVATLLEDLAAGRLAAPPSGADGFVALLAERQPELVAYQGWEAIDASEREAGERQGRPRVKFVRTEELLRAAQRADGVELSSVG